MSKITDLKPFFLNLILIWSTILLFRNFNYYENFLRQDTQLILLIMATGYTFFGAIYYYLNPQEESKGTIVLGIFKKICKNEKFPKIKITKKEKTILGFIVIKIFFLPLMINFFLSNLYIVKTQFLNFPSFKTLLTINSFNTLVFPFLISLIFLIDTLYFAFGYSIESKYLKNKIRSIEPTLLGWVVAIICYPPFNEMFTRYTNWHADIYIFFSSNIITFIIKILILTLFLVYISATLALGTKCSNLTNRGIVTKGPYSIIRHPAYISKNLAWWIAITPIISWPIATSMATWTLIYHLRAITEERHLNQDPEYVKYCKKVKYKYIPYIY